MLLTKPVLEFFHPSIPDQIASLASTINNIYRADVVTDAIQTQLKSLSLRSDKRAQTEEINSLKRIYYICHAHTVSAKNTRVIVLSLLSNQLNYSLSQVNAILKAFNQTNRLTSAKISEICSIIQKMPSADMVSHMEKLITTLSALTFSNTPEKQDEKSYSALDKMLRLDVEKWSVFYELFCEAPQDVTPKPNPERLLNRLSYHVTDLCKMSRPALDELNMVLKLFLAKGIFISDELNQFNRPWLNAIMRGFMRCMSHLDQNLNPNSSTSDFKTFFNQLSENGLVSLENLYAIFQLVSKEEGKSVVMDDIQVLMEKTQVLHDNSVLNQYYFNQLIEGIQKKRQNACKGYLSGIDYGPDNSFNEAGPSYLPAQRTGYTTPLPSYSPPPYSEKDPYPHNIKHGGYCWRQ